MKEFIEKLIGRLEETRMRYFLTIANTGDEELDCVYEYVGKAIDNAISIANELAEEYSADTSQKSANGWIPCSERLPETIDDMLQCVIVTNENDWQGMAYYHPQKGWIFAECHNSDKKIDWTEIIAWQPLPQPYKPQKEAEWKDKVMKHFTKTE